MTEVNFESAFLSLAVSAASLNKFSERCNVELASAQDRLIALNIGIEHWYSRPLIRTEKTGDFGAYETETQFITLLGFAKIRGKWVLGTKEMKLISGFYQGDLDSPFENRYEHTEPSPLLDSSREIRLRAVNALPEFFSEFAEIINKANLHLSRKQE